MYDFRTNVHFTLKQHPVVDADLEDFIRCFNPENRYQRHGTWSESNPDGRWRKFTVQEILDRDKASLDIIENLQSALDGFQELMQQLNTTPE